ncbi:MAG: histidine kinase [Lachnospiraceae bacterium]|nr:histidine kinase [Lachnospiraceae bacterium]
MKNKIENLFGKESSLQRKVIILYLVTAVIPIIIIAGLVSAIYYKSIMKRTDQWVAANARQQEIVVGERMDAFENVLYELVSNKDCIALAKEIDSGDESNLLVNTSKLKSMLESSVYTHEGIRGITFLANNGQYASYTKWYSSFNETIWSKPEVQEEVRSEMGKEKKLTFIASVNLSNAIGMPDYVILMGFPVRNLRTQEQSGVLVMALSCNVLVFEDTESELQKNGVSKVVIDSTGKIVAGVDAEYMNSTLERYKERTYEKPSQLAEKRYEIEGTKWTIVHIIDTELYRQDIFRMLELAAVITGCITLLFFFALYYISQKYIGNVKKIAGEIHNYEGTDAGKAEIAINHKDELYTIVRQFNKMKARITVLVDTLQQRNKEIQIAATNQKHAEIKALEAQINPHFLYNTLDSINWRAIEHEEEEISDMLGALGSLLRYSVSNIDMVVLLRAEISWLKKYVFLQRDRFQNSFDCTYDVTEEAMDFPIYKMLLQPIVENIILHAFEKVKQGGMIEIRAYVGEDKKLVIHIKDNGCGMTGEKLQEIEKEIEETDALNSDSIGISNVIHRLRIYYKDEAGLQVHSKLNVGSEFILTIPETMGIRSTEVL